MCAVKLSDVELLEWLRANLEWDGCGYWLPEYVREKLTATIHKATRGEPE